MFSNYFSEKSSEFSVNFLAIPSKNNPRLAVSLLGYSFFKTGLTLHNTASVKNIIIKKIILIWFTFFKYSKKNVISAKDNLIELLDILRKEQQTGKLYFSSFYIGTSDNANRKITAQVCDDRVNVIGILKIPLVANSEKFIVNEIYISNRLKHYDFQSFIYPVSSFLISDSAEKIIFQKNILKGSKLIGGIKSNVVVEASIELSLKTLSSSCDEYFKDLIQQLSCLELDSVLQKFIKKTANELIGANFPTVLIHGDFVKYNMREKKGKLALIDWEFARTALPLFDLFHFVFQGNIQIKNSTISNAIDKVFLKKNINLINNYMTKLKLNSKFIKSLFTIYLVDNFLFERKLKPNMNINKSNYFKAIKIIQLEKSS